MSSNPMRDIKIAKITLNVGAGKDEELLKRGMKLLEKLSPLTPVKTVTRKRIPSWGLRPGLAIGGKVTVRKNATELLRRLIAAKDNKLPAASFDRQGNISFGIPEYIDIARMEYDPELKILGLEVAVTLERPGFRIKRRKLQKRHIGKAHRITVDEAVSFVRALGVEVS